MRLQPRSVAARDLALLRQLPTAQGQHALRELLARWIDDPKVTPREIQAWPAVQQRQLAGRLVNVLMFHDDAFARVAASITGQPLPDFAAHMQRSAVHESGHAIMSLAVGLAFESVSILPDLDDMGRVTHLRTLAERLADAGITPTPFTAPVVAEATKEVQILVAGELAELLVYGSSEGGGGALDRVVYLGLAQTVCCRDARTIPAFLDEQQAAARRVLEHLRADLDRLAAVLATRKRLTYAQALAAMETGA